MRLIVKYLANFRASFIMLYSKWRRDGFFLHIFLYSSHFRKISINDTRRASKTGERVVIVKINLTPYLALFRLSPCGLTQFPRCRCKPAALAADVKSTLHETTTFGPRARCTGGESRPLIKRRAARGSFALGEFGVGLAPALRDECARFANA